MEEENKRKERRRGRTILEGRRGFRREASKRIEGNEGNGGGGNEGGGGREATKGND